MHRTLADHCIHFNLFARSGLEQMLKLVLFCAESRMQCHLPTQRCIDFHTNMAGSETSDTMYQIFEKRASVNWFSHLWEELCFPFRSLSSQLHSNPYYKLFMQFAATFLSLHGKPRWVACRCSFSACQNTLVVTLLLGCILDDWIAIWLKCTLSFPLEIGSCRMLLNTRCK